ncbi:hypothetical protein GWK47_052738 [Chionoecetes opilio]|uniref:Uncharacterized protein n=1 Tax=Chionoecetes opilio TaxID=41210 RepID=A0A8J5CRM1_CHIOP|nr:hypothetical protein GWK47_052738 [Chionoecetes opilio]
MYIPNTFEKTQHLLHLSATPYPFLFWERQKRISHASRRGRKQALRTAMAAASLRGQISLLQSTTNSFKNKPHPSQKKKFCYACDSGESADPSHNEPPNPLSVVHAARGKYDNTSLSIPRNWIFLADLLRGGSDCGREESPPRAETNTFRGQTSTDFGDHLVLSRLFLRTRIMKSSRNHGGVIALPLYLHRSLILLKLEYGGKGSSAPPTDCGVDLVLMWCPSGNRGGLGHLPSPNLFGDAGVLPWIFNASPPLKCWDAQASLINSCRAVLFDSGSQFTPGRRSFQSPWFPIEAFGDLSFPAFGSAPIGLRQSVHGFSRSVLCKNPFPLKRVFSSPALLGMALSLKRGRPGGQLLFWGPGTCRGFPGMRN